ncbi:hypothetical protein SK128_017539, partial [Halocaridina rubra]
MFFLKYLNLFGGVLLLSLCSLALSIGDPLLEELAMTKAEQDVEGKDPEEKVLLTTFNTSGTSTTVSGAGIVWLLLWGVVLIIIGTAVLCYWVGCEYASTGRRFANMVGLY